MIETDTFGNTFETGDTSSLYIIYNKQLNYQVLD